MPPSQEDMCGEIPGVDDDDGWKVAYLDQMVA